MNGPGWSPGRRAIALEYDGTRAPRVTATGEDALAAQIVAVARAHGVPLMENAGLAALLSQLELGDEIPELLYRCVAQIIAFAYHLRGRTPEGWTPPDEEPQADAQATTVADGGPDAATGWTALPPPERSD